MLGKELLNLKGSKLGQILCENHNNGINATTMQNLVTPPPTHTKVTLSAFYFFMV